MSKWKADNVSKLINENGDLLIMFTVKGFDKRLANMAYEEAKEYESITVEMKRYKAQRSLDQNRMLWSLLGKLTEATSGSKRSEAVTEMYCALLEKANIESEFMLALPEAEETLRKTFRAIRNRGEREYKGKTMNVYQYWLGSSKFDTKQMAELIDILLDWCAEHGVYDTEIEMIRSER